MNELEQRKAFYRRELAKIIHFLKSAREEADLARCPSKIYYLRKCSERLEAFFRGKLDSEIFDYHRPQT